MSQTLAGWLVDGHVDSEGDCFVWQYARDKNGYGVSNGNQKAHRVVWESFYGPIPKGMLICHSCDSPPCVNPDHLFLGSPKDNSRDAVYKGRLAHGEKHYAAKLVEADVRLIRATTPYYGYLNVLAEQFGVSRHLISKVRSKRVWKHLL